MRTGNSTFFFLFLTENKPVETEGARKFLSALPRTTLLLSMELGREGEGLISSEFTV